MEKNDQPAQLDLDNQNAIIKYMRELISFNKILVNGFEYEWNRLWQLLVQHGWGNKDLRQMEQWACSGTLYEKVLPRPDEGCKKMSSNQ